MESPAEAPAILARLYLQTAALAVVFSVTGRCLQRRWLGGSPGGAALEWGRGFFLGTAAFLPPFLVLSRVFGARAALFATLAAMGAITAAELWRMRHADRRAAAGTAVAALLLVALYSVTNAAAWIYPIAPGGPPDVWANLGSIHSGRYANYAIFIADHDRVPWLAQNGAQAMLASVHLLLGVASPLGALVTWLVFSLAFLTLLLFGLFRAAGFGFAPCAAAGALVMFGNTALSTAHVLVFDNGSPFALSGYTDLVLSVGTFLLACDWLQARLSETAPTPAAWSLPALMGLAWSWFAPQDIVVFVATAAAAAAWWRWKRRPPGLFPRLRAPALAFVAMVALGATQFGSLMPAPLREDTGYYTQDAGSHVTVRPYVQYLSAPWTAPRWNLTQHDAHGVYGRAHAQSGASGAMALFVEHAAASLRVFAFPLLGLVLLAIALRRTRVEGPGGTAWLSIATAAFAAGYAIAFGLELDGIKWWLTRFLVPGCAVAMTCLAFAALRLLAGRGASALAAWALLLAASAGPPLAELASIGRTRLLAGAGADTIGSRLDVIARSRGPFGCPGCPASSR